MRTRSVEIYNEFSLQHELGIYLRSELGEGWKAQFERPVGFYGLSRELTVKREIDICVSGPTAHELYAIELKYPRNGQYPEQMFSACKDIMFLEQLVQAGFAGGLFVIAAADRLFYSGVSGHDIYGLFRGGRPVTKAAAHAEASRPTMAST